MFSIEDIKTKAKKFKIYFENSFSHEVVDFVLNFSKLTDVYIFSGVIRNFFLEQNENRDIDIIFQKRDNAISYLNKYQYKKNSFGGYKIEISGTNIDVWAIEDTWGLSVLPTLFENDLINIIPKTAYFNFSSIIYSINKEEFIFSEDFVNFLNKKVIDVVLKQNPNYALCIVNSIYYSDRLERKLSQSLIKQLKFLIKDHYSNIEDVQKKHFGKIIYKTDELVSRINSLK